MTAKETINERRPFRLLNLFTVMFVSVAAVLFVVSFANSVVAAERTSTLKGEVIAVDTYDNLLIVKPSDASRASALGRAGDVTFTLSKMTGITSCNQNKTVTDIVIGEKVTVTYHEREGKLFADAVDEPLVILACYQ